MGLSKEERETLRKLQEKEKEPDAPSGPINFTLDLSSDSAWERAKKLGLVRDDDSSDDEEEESEGDDAPRRRSGYFGES